VPGAIMPASTIILRVMSGTSVYFTINKKISIKVHSLVIR
jgi:hypothetical protein